jgi:hypothetical protein
MLRSVLTALPLAVLLAPAGERLVSSYPEGAVLVCSLKGSFSMEMDEVHMSVDDMELPPEAMEEMELPSYEESTSYRCRNEVLESAEGRPTRMRRVYEELRAHSVDAGEEQDKTGPLEGLALLLSEVDGVPVAEVEDAESEVDALYLANHRLPRDQDFLLPPSEVEIGAEWALDEHDLRILMGLESEPELFEPDEGEADDPFEKAVGEAASVSGKARLIELEEREGLECAVIGFTIEVEATVDEIGALGFELEEGMPEPTGSLEMRMKCEGKLWHALAERRPVALEETLTGSMTMRMESRMPVEDVELVMKMEMQGTLGGETTISWTSGE